jgi:capsular exopolysaccharide synthesis family protein
MSRIHDALKKAQEERAGSSSPGAIESPREIPGSIPAISPLSPAPAEDPASVTKWVAPPAPVKFEELLEQCPVCAWEPDPWTMLFFNGRKHSVGTEEFRILRSKLYQIRDKQPLRTLLVTSALPGEGKTFTAANLAQAIVRQHERRALLIDGDLRRPQLHLSLGTPISPGLSNYLLGEADEISIIQRGPMDNLFFIPRGKEVPNPSELLANGRLKELIERLKPAFDWIIMDSPAAVAVADARTLAGVADGLLLVIQAGSTPFEMAQKVRQEFADKPFLGVVLNRIEPSEGYSSYYSNYYQHPNRTKGKR